MTILDNKYYIIRRGDFAINGNTKIFYSLFSICLCIEEYIQLNSIECFNIMIGSTIIWSIIECFLHYSNTRNIKPMYITNFNGKKIYLNKNIGIFLQGFQEGGVITTIGLYFGDRLFEPKYFYFFHTLIGFIICTMALKPYSDSSVLSKRQINTPSSLGIIGIISIYNVKNLIKNPYHLQRQTSMLFCMLYISSIWTFIAYCKNFRNVEVQIKNNKGEYITLKPTHFNALLILGYDVIFEIGMAYITFYNWFII
jgi:hypothetical protein